MGRIETAGSGPNPHLSTASLPTDWAALVYAEQIKTSFKTIPGSVIGAAMAGLLGVAAMSKEVPFKTLIIWLAVLFSVHAYLLLLYARYQRAAPGPTEIRKWGNHFTAVNFLHGAAFGSIGVFMFRPEFTVYQMWMVLGLFMIAISAITAGIAAYMPMVYAYILPVILPLTIRTAAEGDFLHWMVTVGDVLLLGLILYFAARMNRLIIESFKLRFENEVARERAEEANRAKSRFLAAASHDLRQPLHALGLFVAALNEPTPQLDQPAIIRNINRSLSALDGLFNALLDISKLDAGVVQPVIRDQALTPLLDRLATEFQSQAQAKGLSWRYQAASAYVRTDMALLETVLRNLLGNALRYTRRGDVSLICIDNGAAVTIEVADTGIGIPIDKHREVFREFVQLHNPERDRTKGLGLGLAIVERLSKLLGISLAMESTPGTGSVFRLQVPRGDAAAAAAAPAQVDELIREEAALRVMVIEDERDIREAMAILLDNWGHQVVIVSSDDEAIASGGSIPDAIIADYRLRDGKTGVDAISRLRAHWGHGIPAIVVTGDTAPERLQQVQESGFACLHKPVSAGKLRAFLRGVQRQRSSAH